MITIVRQASVVSESLSIDFLIQIGTATKTHTHNIARMNKPIDFFFLIRPVSRSKIERKDK